METHKNNLENKPTFEIEERGQSTRYVFDNVVVAINRKQENENGAPELTFGTFDYDSRYAVLDQPTHPRKKVNMQYVAECIGEVVRHSRERRFWINPYSGDAAQGNEEVRADARAKLFGKYAELEECENGGYFVTL